MVVRKRLKWGAQLTFAIGLSMTANATRAGEIIYVDDSALGGLGDGSSWRDAYTDLQQAIAAAQDGDQVSVAQGVYKPGPPGGARTASFVLAEGVVLQGGYAGLGAPDPNAIDPKAHITILSGDLNNDDGRFPVNYGDNAFNVVRATAVTQATAMRGFQITSGYADNLSNCSPTQNSQSRGGGLRLDNNASPIIEECLFVANAARCHGGGASFDGGNPVFRRCRFSHNHSTDYQAGYGAGSAAGGYGNPEFEDCEFIDNRPAEVGGAVWLFQGGQFRRCRFEGHVANDGGAVLGSNFSAIDCVFLNNAASTGGGAVWGRNLTFINCSFLGNQVPNCTAGGGAIVIFSQGAMQLVNCLFAGNSGARGAVDFRGDAPSEVINCTFIGNVSPGSCGGGGGLSSNASLLRVANCIFWGNSSNNAGALGELSVPATTIVANNIIEDYAGLPAGPNNSSADPLFVDADGPDNVMGTIDDNARLTSRSPARDSGNNRWLPIDAHDLDQDGNVMEAVPFDLDGNYRVVLATADRGAYEFPNLCVGDIAPPGGDGHVAVDDLLVVIAAWGPCANPNNCPADIAPAPSGDDIVNVQDMLAVIGA